MWRKMREFWEAILWRYRSCGAWRLSERIWSPLQYGTYRRLLLL